MAKQAEKHRCHNEKKSMLYAAYTKNHAAVMCDEWVQHSKVQHGNFGNFKYF